MTARRESEGAGARNRWVPLSLVVSYALLGGLSVPFVAEIFLRGVGLEGGEAAVLLPLYVFGYVLLTVTLVTLLVSRVVGLIADAETGVVASAQRLRGLYRNGLVGMLRLRRTDGTLEDCNARFAEMVGYATPADAMVGFSVERHCPEAPWKEEGRSKKEEVGGEKEEGRRKKEEGRAEGRRQKAEGGMEEWEEYTTREIEVTRADGRTAWLRCTIFSDVDGETVSALAVDVTGAHVAGEELRRSHEMLAGLVEHAALAIVEMDAEGRVRRWNRAAERMFGWEAREALGQTNPIVPPEKMEEFRGLVRRAFAGEVFTGMEATRRRRDGAAIEVSISTAPLRDEGGTVTSVVSVLEDVTGRKRAEERTQRLTEGLREVLSAADELLSAADRETFLRRAVEIPRERLGFERTGLQLLDESGTRLHGTYGTGRGGVTTDEHDYVGAVGPLALGALESTARGGARWYAEEKDLGHGAEGRIVGHGWNAATPVTAGGRVLGVFFTDAAWSGAPLDEVAHEVLAVYGSVVGNMLARREADEELRVERSLFATLLESVPEHIYFKDAESRFTRVSASLARSFGASDAREVRGKSDHDFFTEEHADQARRDELEVMASGQAMVDKEEEETWPDGHRTTVRSSKVPIVDGAGRVVGTLGISRDVTERVEAQRRAGAFADGLQEVLRAADELLASASVDELLRRAVELARERLGVERAGIWLLSEDGQTMEGSFGTNLARETTDERGVRRGPDPYEVECWEESRRGGPRWHLRETTRFELEDGEPRDLGPGWLAYTPFSSSAGQGGVFFNDAAISGAPVDETQQDILAVYGGLVASLLQRKRADEALAAEKERLAVTLRSIGDGVITADAAGRVGLMNPVAEEMTGWKQEEATGRDFTEVFRLISEQTREEARNPAAQALESGETVAMANHMLLVARDGTERAVEDSAAPIRDGRGEVLGAVLVFRDVTEKRRMVEELQRADKLESVGVLAGGIAHDFNNILTAVAGNLSIVRGMTAAGTQAAELLAEAESAALRARDLTQQLLTFAKGGAPVRAVADVGRVAEDAVRFALRGSKASPEMSVAEDLWAAEIDAGQVGQALHNLAVNAAQAMGGAGRVWVTARNVELTAPDAELAAGPYVRIEMRDEGPGVEEAVAGRIFEPYFTTKATGSGLGLATSYAIARNHDGTVRLLAPGTPGATFEVLLPATTRTAPKAEERAEAPSKARRGRALVMDDDRMVREVVVLMLGSLGFEAEGVVDGQEAVRRYAECLAEGRRFDLVVMDLTIPGGMGGEEAIRILREMDPEVTALVSSGYSTSPVMAQYADYGFSGVIAKPYRAHDLALVLEEVLPTEDLTTP